MTFVEQVQDLVGWPTLLVRSEGGEKYWEELRSGDSDRYLFLKFVLKMDRNSDAFFMPSMGFRDDKFKYEKKTVFVREFAVLRGFSPLDYADNFARFLSSPMSRWRYHRVTEKDRRYLKRVLVHEKEQFWEIIARLMIADHQLLRKLFWTMIIFIGIKHHDFMDTQERYEALERSVIAAKILEK